MRFSLAGIVAFSFLIGIAWASDWVTDGRFAVGLALSCADWVKDQKYPLRSNQDVSWMFGFLTALVRAKGAIEGGGMTAEDFPSEIDELCAASPDASIPAILEIFAVRHKLIAPDQPKHPN